MVVFFGVIMYKVSLIFSKTTESYSPIDQQNENEASNDETLGEVSDSHSRKTVPRIERTLSTGSGDTRPMKDESEHLDTDIFNEEGLQDKVLKLKL